MRLFIIFIFFLLLSGCATSGMDILRGGGTVMKTSAMKLPPLSPQEVKLYYNEADVPKQYTVIGHVNVSNENSLATRRSKRDIDQELRNQAAAIGGNGVICIKNEFEQVVGEVIFSPVVSP